MQKLHASCHAEVALSWVWGQIHPLPTSLTCLNAFKLPIRQTSCCFEKQGVMHREHSQCSEGFLYLPWGCGLALLVPVNLPWTSALTATYIYEISNAVWVVDIACNRSRWKLFILSPGCLAGQAGWVRQISQLRSMCRHVGKLWRSLTLQCSAACWATGSKQHVKDMVATSAQGQYKGRVAAHCPTLICKERWCVLFMLPKDAGIFWAEGLWRNKNWTTITYPVNDVEGLILHCFCRTFRFWF